jgi:hypothetical protein
MVRGKDSNNKEKVLQEVYKDYRDAPGAVNSKLIMSATGVCRTC